MCSIFEACIGPGRRGRSSIAQAGRWGDTASAAATAGATPKGLGRAESLAVLLLGSVTLPFFVMAQLAHQGRDADATSHGMTWGPPGRTAAGEDHAGVVSVLYVKTTVECDREISSFVCQPERIGEGAGRSLPYRNSAVSCEPCLLVRL